MFNNIINGLKDAWQGLSVSLKAMLLVCARVVVGLGGLFMYLLRAHTYFIGDNPSACVNCHIMTPYYATWSHSSHARDVTCNDCHVPHSNLLMKYGFKAVDGLKHTAYVVTHSERQAMWMLVVCFLLLQMCWWGINYLPSAQGASVHTYGA